MLFVYHFDMKVEDVRPSKAGQLLLAVSFQQQSLGYCQTMKEIFPSDSDRYSLLLIGIIYDIKNL